MDTVSLICTLVYVLVYICILYTSVYFLPTFLTPLMRGNVRRFALLVYFYYKSILYVSIINIFTTILCSVLCLDVQCYPMDCSLPGFSVHEDSSGKNTGVGCHALFQGIFPTQVSNLGLLHCRWIICHLSHQGSPVVYIYLKIVRLLSQVALVVKNPSANAGDVKDPGLIPGLGRSPGGGNGNRL